MAGNLIGTFSVCWMGCFQSSVSLKLGYNPSPVLCFSNMTVSSLKTFVWLKIKWKKRLCDKPGCHSLNSVLVNSEVMWKKMPLQKFYYDTYTYTAKYHESFV